MHAHHEHARRELHERQSGSTFVATVLDPTKSSLRNLLSQLYQALQEACIPPVGLSITHIYGHAEFKADLDIR